MRVKVAYLSNINHEHAFPLTESICKSANATNGGSNVIMSTVRPELPYPCISLAKSGDETSQRRK